MKVIALTKFKFALVDDEDYEWLNQWKWYAAKQGKKLYASRRIGKHGKLVHMHRLILGINDAPLLIPDHIDRNSLNNQRANLRIATRSQNNSNRTPVGASKYLGVFLQPMSKRRPWYSRIVKDGVSKYLGSFKYEQEAALAYNKAATEIHGEFANLNVIEEGSNILSARDQIHVPKYGSGFRGL